MLSRLMGRHVAPLLCLMVFVVTAPAQLLGQSVQERFQLLTYCAPVGLYVDVQIDNNDRISLSEEAVTRAVRSRLKGARVYTDTIGEEWLSVWIQVSAGAFIALMLSSRGRCATPPLSHPGMP